MTVPTIRKTASFTASGTIQRLVPRLSVVGWDAKTTGETAARPVLRRWLSLPSSEVVENSWMGYGLRNFDDSVRFGLASRVEDCLKFGVRVGLIGFKVRMSRSRRVCVG